jgi:hypothetical protein
VLFLAIFLQATRNGGIVEQRNTGYGKRKKIYSTKNVAATFFYDAHQASIFCFLPNRLFHQNKKINAIICALNSVFFKPIIPRFQYSIIPSGA